MVFRCGAVGALLLFAGAANAQSFSPDRLRADVAFLADDLLEGRGTGTRGYDLAARFEGLGLKPGGTVGWYQDIQFVSAAEDPARRSAVTLNAKRFEHGGHVIVSPFAIDPAVDGSAAAVFVGWGMEDERYRLHDYQGLDVKGKIVVLMRGAPAGLPSEVAATLSQKKIELAASKGAVGVITIATQEFLRVFPWPKSVANSAVARMRYVHPDGHIEDVTAPLRLSALIDPVAAEQLFKGSPIDGQVAAILADNKIRPIGFALSSPIRVERFSKIDRVRSANVLGLLEGSDQELKHEMIMLTAHLDHLGIMPGGTGDRIANGAMDNAVGVATMLEAARAFAESGRRPKRSVLFVALTGEEKDLLGSEFLSKYPVEAGMKLVANVNLDEPLITYDFTDVIAFGADHSTIGGTVARAASSLGIKLSLDPRPEQNTFVRSDHYKFVQEGVPAIMLSTGYANGGEAAWKQYEDHHYHDPSDDLRQPIDWAAGARFAKLNYLIARDLADAPTRPLWYQDDFFGDKFAWGAPKARRR